MSPVPRRRLLQLCGGTVATALAGCQDDSDATDARTLTDTQTASGTPTDTGTTADSNTEVDSTTQAASNDESATRTPSPASAVWTVDELTAAVHGLVLPESGPTDDPSGPLYAASGATEVARVDPVDGRTEWTTTLRGREAQTPAVTPTADAVFAVSETYTDERLANHVQAIDPGTGDVRWTFEDRVFLDVIGVVDGLVVLAGDVIAEHPEEIGPNRSPRGDGRIYGVEGETGDERWRVDVPDLRGADLADHGVYALETRDHETNQLRLLAFDTDGDERWRVDTGTINPGAPVAAGEDLLLAGAGEDDATDRGGLGRYDPADGSLRWTAGDWERGPNEVRWQDGIIHASGRSFLAVNPDGSERYRVSHFSVPDVPATPETLYNDGGSTIPAVDRSDGEIRWRYRPDDYEYTHLRAVLADSVAVDRGIGPDRTVVLLSEASGEVVGTFGTDGPYHAAVGAGRRLFLGVGSDVVAFDVATDLA